MSSSLIMATLLYADGRKETVKPSNGKTFELEELQGFVHGYIEIVNVSEGRLLVVDDEGLFKPLSLNPNASAVAEMLIVGDALLCNSDEID